MSATDSTNPEDSPAAKTDYSQDLRKSVTDGSCWAVMMGFGEQMLQPLILALALGERATGLVATLPFAIGAFLSLLTPFAVERVKSHKKWTVFCAGLQAFCLIPLAIGAWVGTMPAWLIFIIIALYGFGGLSAGVAWSTWISTLVDNEHRAKFFSFRNRMIWTFQLGAILLAGWMISLCSKSQHLIDFATRINITPELLGLGTAMAIASIARLVSTVLLSRIAEPQPLPQGHRHVGLLEVISRLSHGPDARLMVYFLLVAFATNISLGYLNPFVLGPQALNEPKQHWALVMAAMMVGRIIILAFLAKIINKIGAKRTMIIAGLLLIPIHLLMIPAPFIGPHIESLATSLLPASLNPIAQGSGDLAWVMLVQFLAGMIYATYDLSSWLLLIRHTDAAIRTSMIATTWCGFWIASFLGTAAATLILQPFKVEAIDPSLSAATGTAAAATSVTIFSLTGYIVIFAVTTLARIITAWPLLTWVRKLPD